MDKKEIASRIRNMESSTFVDGIAKSLVDILSMAREERIFTKNAVDCVSNHNYCLRMGDSEAQDLFELYQAEEELEQIEAEVKTLLREVNGSLLDFGIDEDIKGRFAEKEAFYTEEFLNKQCEKVNIDNLYTSALRLKSHIVQRCDTLNVYNDLIGACHGLSSTYGKVLDNVGYFGSLETMQEILEERADIIVRAVRESMVQDKRNDDEDEPNA
ncbi:MAG: hypothetical protein IKC11_04735 [Clostridia bacterium]|nr:hypothetical protein [Clostridia bacterium]